MDSAYQKVYYILILITVSSKFIFFEPRRLKNSFRLGHTPPPGALRVFVYHYRLRKDPLEQVDSGERVIQAFCKVFDLDEKENLSKFQLSAEA